MVQRVNRAEVGWSDAAGADHRNEIGRGLAILVGAGPSDLPGDAARLADKVATLRIFPDAESRFQYSLEEVGGEALVVSQFTLYANATRGRRPSFAAAAPPERAERMCELFAKRLAERGVPTRHGAFGARMLVSLENDGPVTLVLSTDDWETRIG